MSRLQRSSRDLVVVGASSAVLGALAWQDGLVAAMAAIAGVALYVAVRFRGPRNVRRVVALSSAMVVSVGAGLALALPVLAQRPAPLIVNLDAARPVAGAAASVHTPRPSFEIVGYVASDYEDSASGVDRDAASVTSLAPTSVSLGPRAGTLEVADARDTLVRAHAAGSRAELVVSNYDGTDFNPQRVEQLLASREASNKFISALTKLVASGGWDGVVIDFERLSPAVRASFPALLETLHGALGSRAIDVAVPAFSDPSDPDLRGYDLAKIGRIADAVTWMAYDEHELSTPAGPVASMRWVNATLDLALHSIPPKKLLLGIASYGYAWRAPGHAVEYSAAAFHSMMASGRASLQWDATTAEWTGTLRDGSAVWMEDGASMRARTQLALARGLDGVALWRVGAEEPNALAQLPVEARKETTSVTGARGHTVRAIRDVHASDVVALTFDDGPDPRWTPKILAILRREHVPATFFVIGQQAQRHQRLVRAEIRNGDVIGNHTYAHKDLSRLGSWRSKLEIEGGAAVIEGITGHSPLLFRSPYGKGDASTQRVGADQLADDLGEHAVGWNVDPLDWARPGADTIVARVTGQVQERSVVLLHDGGGDRSETVAALPRIIEALKAHHALFTTVDGLDGSIASPYRSRSGGASNARAVAIIAGFRLWVAGRKAFLLLLEVIAVLSLLRLLLAVPLALAQAHRARRARPRLASSEVAAAAARLSVTIAVPAHNEAAVIAKTVESLQQVVHPGGPGLLDIIVVDDGSSDATAEIAGEVGARCSSPRTRVVSQPPSKKAGALNRAFHESNADVVVVIDADTVVDPGLVTAMLPHFTDPQVAAVAGNVRVGNASGLMGRLQALEYVVSLNLDRRAQAAANVMAVVPGAAGAFRRDAVIAVGGYSTDTLVEDADLTVALLAAGWRIPYEPRAVAYTEAPETLADVVRQRRRWAFGTVEVLAKHRRAILSRGQGRLGLLGLPWMLVSQVVLPLFGPACDLFVAYLLAVHNLSEAAGIVAVAVACDVMVAAVVAMANRERLRALLYVPLLRFVWRPLQLYAICASTLHWLGGRSDGWRKVTRYNSVVAPFRAVPTLPGVDARGRTSR